MLIAKLISLLFHFPHYCKVCSVNWQNCGFGLLPIQGHALACSVCHLHWQLVVVLLPEQQQDSPRALGWLAALAENNLLNAALLQSPQPLHEPSLSQSCCDVPNNPSTSTAAAHTNILMSMNNYILDYMDKLL